jgi:hypothetical protein
MWRSISGVIGCALGLASLPAAAQSFPGRLGGSCVDLPAEHQQFVTIDAAAPAGATLIVTVAVSSNFVSELSLDDGLGSVYQALGGMRSGAAGAVVHFRTTLQRPLAAGQMLQLNYGNAGSTVQSCVSVLGFAGIPAAALVQNAVGATSGQSATLAVNATSASAPGHQLVLASFATGSSPLTIGATPPAQLLTPLCSASSSLCLLDAYYVGDDVGTAAVTLTADSAIAWSGALTALYADGIFGNGFD